MCYHNIQILISAYRAILIPKPGKYPEFMLLRYKINTDVKQVYFNLDSNSSIGTLKSAATISIG